MNDGIKNNAQSKSFLSDTHATDSARNGWSANSNAAANASHSRVRAHERGRFVRGR